MWIVMLIALSLFGYGDHTAVRWVSPVGTNTLAGIGPPSNLSFILIQTKSQSEILAVSVDENDAIDFDGATCSGDVYNEKLDENHTTLGLKFVVTDVCAIVLSETTPSYQAGVAGSAKDTEQSTLQPFKYYLVQQTNISLDVNENQQTDAKVAAFSPSGSNSVKAIRFLADCNNPDFNGNLKYDPLKKAILLAEPISSRVSENWGDIVCLLSLQRDDGKTDYAIGVVKIVETTVTEVEETQTPPTCPSNNTAELDLTFARSSNPTEDVDVVPMQTLAMDLENDHLTYSLDESNKTMFRFEESTDRLKLKTTALKTTFDGTYEISYTVNDGTTSVNCRLSLKVGPDLKSCFEST